MRICSFILVLYIGTAPAQEYKPREVVVNRIHGEIKINGYLNEDCWKEATRIEDTLRDWWTKKGEIADVKTVALVGYDPENLYFGFICYENDMRQLRANATQFRWYQIVNDDRVMINLNTFINRYEWFNFQINPRGVHKADYNLCSSPGFWLDWYWLDRIWFAEAKMLDSCWTVEVKIPFRSIRFPSDDTNRWRMQFSRKRPREYEYVYYWGPRPNRYVGDFFVYGNKIIIPERIAVKGAFDFLPYFTGGMTVDTSKIDFTERLGVSGKYYFSYNNILDWTVMPDFSQIESDAPQIDVNATFALYYPERRPFFLERKSFFETPLEVFYSRTINDPLGAFKFTGGVKDINLGFISSYDLHTPWVIPFAERSYSVASDKKSLTNVIRVKGDLLNNVNWGFLLTNRDLIGSFNRVASFDGSIVFLRYYSFAYQGILSWTREPNDTTIFNGSPGLGFGRYTSAFDGEDFIGKGFYLNLGHKSRYLDINGYYHGLSPEFRADNGFFQYNDYEDRGLKGSFSLPLRRFIVEALTANLSISEKNRSFGERTGLERVGALSILFPHQVNLEFTYRLTDSRYEGNYFKDMWSYSGNVSISAVKFFSLGGYVGYGRKINYFAQPPNLGYNLVPSLWGEVKTKNINLKLSYNHYILWQDDFDQRIYDSETFENEFNWSFTHYLNLRILLQYSSYDNKIFISPLLSFTPTPLTVFYLGSNHDLRRSTDSNSYGLTESKIFIKLQYLLKW